MRINIVDWLMIMMMMGKGEMLGGWRPNIGTGVDHLNTAQILLVHELKDSELI